LQLVEIERRSHRFAITEIDYADEIYLLALWKASAHLAFAAAGNVAGKPRSGPPPAHLENRRLTMAYSLSGERPILPLGHFAFSARSSTGLLEPALPTAGALRSPPCWSSTNIACGIWASPAPT
jgi:hypothetical protein